MKKYILLSAICVMISQMLSSQAKEPTLQLYKNGEIIKSIKISDIDSLKIEDVLAFPSF